MQTVSVARDVAADPEAVREAISDVESFTAAGGFDEVTVDGDVVEIENRVGFATMSLTLERLDDDAALSLRQREGIFEEMHTSYEVEPTDAGSHVIATTEFEFGASILGKVLDGTVIQRQRTKELQAQLAYLQDLLE